MRPPVEVLRGFFCRGQHVSVICPLFRCRSYRKTLHAKRPPEIRFKANKLQVHECEQILRLPKPLFPRVPHCNPSSPLSGPHSACPFSQIQNKSKRVGRFLLDACNPGGLEVVAARVALPQLLPPNATSLGDITSDGGWAGLTGNQIWTLSSVLGLLFATIFADVSSMVSASFPVNRDRCMCCCVSPGSTFGIDSTFYCIHPCTACIRHVRLQYPDCTLSI